MFWRDATDVGGIKSGSTERARGEKIKLLSKRVRGRIFQSGMSCLVKPPSFPLLLRVYTIVWYLFAHRRALPLWLRCQRKVCLSWNPLSHFFPSSSISVWLSAFLSSFLKCCFFKVSPNNSALELNFASLFLCLLGQYSSCGFRFCFCGRQKYLTTLYFVDFSVTFNRQAIKMAIMVVPG